MGNQRIDRADENEPGTPNVSTVSKGLVRTTKIFFVLCWLVGVTALVSIGVDLFGSIISSGLWVGAFGLLFVGINAICSSGRIAASRYRAFLVGPIFGATSYLSASCSSLSEEPSLEAIRAQIEANLRVIEEALTLYRLDNFSYPATDEGLQALVTSPGEAAAPNWKPFLRQLPRDPWSVAYHYRNPSEHGSDFDFDIFTLGRDGQEGGDGLDADIGNWMLQDRNRP